MNKVYILRGGDAEARRKWCLKHSYSALFPNNFDQFMHDCSPHRMGPQSVIINADNLDLHTIAPYAAYAKAMRISCIVVTFDIKTNTWGQTDEEAREATDKARRLREAQIPACWGVHEEMVNNSKSIAWWNPEAPTQHTADTILEAVRKELRRPEPNNQRLRRLVGI